MAYHDRSLDSALRSTPFLSRKGVTVPFPVKLHQLIEHAEAEGLTDIVGWQPHGRCFVIRDPEAFSNTLLPRFFRQTKFASFRRQLNLYGFSRLTRGRDMKGYYHELFLRGKEALAYRIVRLPINGRGARGKSTPELEPDFYAMESIDDENNGLALAAAAVYSDYSAEDIVEFELGAGADEEEAIVKEILFLEHPAMANILDEIEHELVSLR